ncbi:MAG: redoxin domain-containing protein [Firmicutes bacterium]|nr:redoxin domain-containing protein [Bacillota bacterium]
MQLHRDYREFEKRDVVIAVLGPEDAEAFRSYWSSNSLPFIGLPDEKHSVLKLYGQQVNIFKLGRMPAQMIVDKEGLLRYVHYGHSMQDIPRNDELLPIIDRMAQRAGS